MGMEQERIAQIRALGDRLAELILREDDRNLFRSLFYNLSYRELRNLLIKTSARYLKQPEPVIRLEEFLAVFEDGDGLGHSQWDLGRDLVLIRVLGRLHEERWLVEVKHIRTRAGAYPYVSAQAFRYWLRSTLERNPDLGWTAAPIYRGEKVAYTDANPIRWHDRAGPTDRRLRGDEPPG